MVDPLYDYHWLWLDTELESDRESDKETDVESKGMDIFVSLLPMHECMFNMFNAILKAPICSLLIVSYRLPA